MEVTVTARRRTRALAVAPRADWRRYRDLVVVTAVRLIKVRYRGSFLGVYWSLSNPLLMTGIYTAIFGTAFASYYGGSIVNYVLAVFTGLAVLNFFSQSTSTALPSIVGNGGLLNKLALPPSMFPVSCIAAAVFQMCVGVLPLLMLVALWTSHNPLNAIALIVPIIALSLLSLGFALAVSAAYVYFRDLAYLYELVIFVIWFTSPIFYPAAIVPAQIRRFIGFNPLASIIESVRQIALSGMRPSIHLMAYAMVGGVVAAIVGLAVFASSRRGFMDLV